MDEECREASALELASESAYFCGLGRFLTPAARVRGENLEGGALEGGGRSIMEDKKTKTAEKVPATPKPKPHPPTEYRAR